MTNTADLVATEAALRDLASEAGLPLVAALYPTTAVFLDAGTPLATLVSVAKTSGAAFLSLDAETFDAERFLDEARAEAHRDGLVLTEGAEEVVEAAARGDAVERLTLEWCGGGQVFVVTFVADWAAALSRRLQGLTEEDPEPSWEEVRAHIHHLAELIEATPAFRAAQPIRRRAAAASIVQSIADADDDETRRRAIDEAYRLAADRSHVAYYAFDTRRAEAAAELAASVEWSVAFTQAARRAAAARFLTTAVGYAPTASEADGFARLARSLGE